MEKDPHAINNILSVLTSPILVLIIVPSIKGRRSLCTPSLEIDLPVS
jgi:hypothetical protein